MALLPRVRPKAGSYGRAIKNERPVRNAELEADATDYNNMRDDLAFVGAVSALARLKVINDGTVAVLVAATGIEDSLVTVTRLAVGHVRVELAAGAGVVVTEAGGWPYGVVPVSVAIALVGPGVVDIRSSIGSVPSDVGFTLLLF